MLLQTLQLVIGCAGLPFVQWPSLLWALMRISKEHKAIQYGLGKQLVRPVVSESLQT